MALFYSVLGGMRKDLPMAKKFLNIVITDFEESKYNRDLCAKGLEVTKNCKDVLDEIDTIIDKSKSKNPTTKPSTQSAQPRGFEDFIENSKELQKLGDCLWNISTFFSYAVNINVNTLEVREKIVKLIDELNRRTELLHNIIVEVGSKRSRWSSSLKKKIKALGKFSSIFKQKKSLNAIFKDSSNLKIPIDQLKSSYNFDDSQTSDITSNTTEVNPIVRGSRNHIRLHWYTGVKRVAEKEVGNFNVGDEKHKELIEEIKFMSDLSSCQHILKFYGYCQRSTGFSVISQWEEHNLQTYLIENIDLAWIEKLSIARGIANALNYCHKKDILHYDIRTENVLLDQHLQPKLYNFRIDKNAPVMLTSSTASLDTPRYSSPERIRSEKYTKASEIYSFAIVLWEIQHHKLPYDGLPPETISEKILNGEYPPQKPVNGTPVEFQNIIQEAWAKVPEERPNMEKLYDNLDKLDSRYFSKQKVDLIGYKEENEEKEEEEEEEHIDDSDDAELKTPKITLDKEILLEKSPEIVRGIKYHQVKQYKKAWKIFKEYESRSNDIDGKYWVGYYYLKGWYEGKRGTPNPKTSVSFLRLAADSGHADAQFLYATTIINHGVAAKEHNSRDRTKIAIDCLKKSAKQDHPDALRMLGGIIRKGQFPQYGLSKDIMMGKAMIEKSYKKRERI